MTFFTDNWELFKDKQFSSLVLPGSHNSTSFYISGDNPIVSDDVYLKKIDTLPGFVKNSIIELNKFCNTFAKTQTCSITDQLVINNIRSFDIRVCKHPKNDGEKLYTHHTFLGKEFALILQEFAAFLVAYPKEIVELKIKWTDTASRGLTDNVINELFLKENGVTDYIVPYSQTELKIEEYVSLNKRLFVFIDEYEKIPQVWGNLYDFQDSYLNTNIPDAKIIQLKAQLAAVTKNYDLSYILTPQTGDYITMPEKRLSFLSGICKCFKIDENASQSLQDLDKKLPKFDPETFGRDLYKVHIISMDFVDTKDLANLCLDINKKR